MKRKTDSPGRVIYGRRLATVEPVFANIGWRSYIKHAVTVFDRTRGLGNPAEQLIASLVDPSKNNDTAIPA